MKDKNSKKNGFCTIKKHYAGALLQGTFQGRVSNFNQGLIISLAALIVLIFLCISALKFMPQTLIPLFVGILKSLFIAIAILITASFIRHCFVKPQDDSGGVSTKILGMNAVIEINNIPQSLLTKEFIEAVCSLRFFQNDPPVGLIKGDPADKKSIVMLNEDERERIKKEEEAAILEHQKKIREEIKNLPQPTTNTS